MRNDYGSSVFRGRVLSANGDGTYVIEGMDQPGIVTLPLAMPPVMLEAEPKLVELVRKKIEPGSVVIYCEFADGQGAIFMPMG